MRVSEFATQPRLHQLRCIYHELSPSAQEVLGNAAQSLGVGRRPPRVWAYVDDGGRVIRTETSVDET